MEQLTYEESQLTTKHQVVMVTRLKENYKGGADAELNANIPYNIIRIPKLIIIFSLAFYSTPL